jgi:hypothetical protein
MVLVGSFYKFLMLFYKVLQLGLREASYIPTPEKFSNPKCGLINISES